MSDRTKKLLKERFSVLAVIMSCLALVIVVQAAQQLFRAKARPTPTAPAAAAASATPRAEAKEAQATPLGTKTGILTSTTPSTQASPPKRVNLSGKWIGSFTETVEGNTLQ